MPHWRLSSRLWAWVNTLCKLRSISKYWLWLGSLRSTPQQCFRVRGGLDSKMSFRIEFCDLKNQWTGYYSKTTSIFWTEPPFVAPKRSDLKIILKIDIGDFENLWIDYSFDFIFSLSPTISMPTAKGEEVRGSFIYCVDFEIILSKIGTFS